MTKQDCTSWPKGTPIKVIKLSACEGHVVPSSAWHDWSIDGGNSASFPVDYEVEGFLTEAMQLGKPIIVFRTHRNGVRVDGLFYTTPVKEFKNGAAITLNSIYFIKKMEGPLRVIESIENEGS